MPLNSAFKDYTFVNAERNRADKDMPRVPRF